MLKNFFGIKTRISASCLFWQLRIWKPCTNLALCSLLHTGPTYGATQNCILFAAGDRQPWGRESPVREVSRQVHKQ
jgi:hypothetical protein